ncbi:MAG TPA: DUF11 domain-containing protein, partial [Acidobacteriota bacterium]
MRRILLLVWLLLIHAAAASLEARSVLNFPRLSFEQNTLTGIAIVNPTDQLAAVTLTAFGTDGRPLAASGLQNPAQLTIAANQQTAKLTSELFGSGVDPSTVAWFQATSSVDGLAGFFLFLNGSITVFDGADLPESASAIIFNLVRQDLGFSTELNIVNPGDGVANIELRLMGAGMSPPARTLTLAAKGVARIDPASFFGISTLSPGAYVAVSSNVEVAGFEFVKSSTGDLLGLNARNASEQLSELNFPQMAVLGPWKTELGLLNYSTKQVTVTVTAYRADGTPYASPNLKNNPVTRTLEAGGSLREDVEAMFGFTGPNALDGWIQAQSSAAAINGYVTYGLPSIGSLAAVAGSGQGRTRAIFSHIATSQGFFNGIAILNSGTGAGAKSAVTAANVRVLAIRPNGQILGSYDTVLQPRQRISKLIDELIPAAAGQSGGLIWVKSDSPVNLTSLFGTSNGAVLANIPAQPAPDSYNPDSGPAADLSVNKSAAPNPVIVGNNLTYTVTVTNNGPSAATAVALTDSLPAGVTFVSANATQGSCAQSGGSLNCNLGTLANNAVATVTIIVTPAAAGTITNTAGVRGNELDPNSANNTAAVTTTVNSPNSADLSIVKTGSPNPVTVNSNLTYLITVTNGGPSAATGISVTDTLPPGVTFVSATPTQGTCGSAGGTLTCDLGSLPLAAVLRITIVVTPRSTGTISNTASVKANETDPNLANNVATATTTVSAANNPDLSIAKSHSGNFTVGTNGVYTVTVQNVGSAATTAVIIVTDALPSGLSFVSATGTGWSCSASGQVVTCSNGGPIAAGSGSSITLTVSPTTAGTVTNTVSVSTSGDTNAANNSASDPTTISAALAPDLSVAKSHTGSFTVGTNGVYTITVQNIGSAATTAAITVTDVLPSGLSFVSGTGTGWSCSAAGQTVTCTNAGPLAAGASSSITLTVSPGTAGTVTNTVSVSTSGDTNSSNNSASDLTTVNGVPDLSISKNHGGSFTVGTNGSYTITVQNVGSGPTTGLITVTDTLPAGLTYFSGTGSGWSCSPAGQTVTCTNSGPIAAGSNSTITLTVSPTTPGSVTNSVTVSTSGDSNAANNSTTDPTTINGVSDLSITKTHSGNFTVGVNGVYTITVQNVGSAATGAITVTDVLPTGLSFVSGTGTGWGCSAAGQTVTCTNPGPLAVSASSTITLTVGVAAAAVPSVTNTATVSTSGDNNAANNSSSNPTTVNGVPDLSITKTHSGNFTVGVNGTYTITVQNVGSGATTATITVTDTLPAGLGFVSGTGSGWSCSAAGQTVTCTNAGPIAVSASSSITLTVSVAAGAAPSATNNASVSTSGDTNAANNSTSDPTTVTPSADVRITSQTNPGSCSVPCSSVTFTIVVNNAGPSTVTAATLTDTLPLDPAGSGATVATYLNSTGSDAGVSCSPSGVLVNCTLPTMASGASVTVKITMSIDDTAQGRNITNNASVSAGGGVTDPNSANNSSSSSMPVFPTNIIMDLAVTSFTGSPSTGTVNSTTFTYTAGVINNGPSSSQNVTFTLTLGKTPSGASGSFTGGGGGTCSVAGSTVTCNLGTLKRSDTRTITVTTKFSATGTAFTNTANVTFGTQTGGLTGGTSSDP